MRWNAGFPYVSPAAYVKIDGKRRRLVDAGYFDNYGVGPAVAILMRADVRAWLKKHDAKVTILQLRASGRKDVDPGPVARAFEFVTTPVEGVGAAREESMISRNDSAIMQLQALLPGQVDTEVCTLNEEARSPALRHRGRPTHRLSQVSTPATWARMPTTRPSAEARGLRCRHAAERRPLQDRGEASGHGTGQHGRPRFIVYQSEKPFLYIR